MNTIGNTEYKHRNLSEQGGEGYSLTVLCLIFVVLRLYHENLRAEFAQPFAPLPFTFEHYVNATL